MKIITIADLLANPKYELKKVEKSHKYFSAKRDNMAVRYTGREGTGYRVFHEIDEKAEGFSRTTLIYYFIERK